MRIVLAILLAACAAVPTLAQRNPYVPDAATAEAIARAVLIPVYGAEMVRREEPLMATPEGDYWVVRGTLHCPEGQIPCVGGTMVVQIDRRDGRIIGIDHL